MCGDADFVASAERCRAGGVEGVQFYIQVDRRRRAAEDRDRIAVSWEVAEYEVISSPDCVKWSYYFLLRTSYFSTVGCCLSQLCRQKG